MAVVLTELLTFVIMHLLERLFHTIVEISFLDKLMAMRLHLGLLARFLVKCIGCLWLGS